MKGARTMARIAGIRFCIDCGAMVTGELRHDRKGDSFFLCGGCSEANKVGFSRDYFSRTMFNKEMARQLDRPDIAEYQNVLPLVYTFRARLHVGP